MTRYLILPVLAAVILTDGYLCGRWSGRWNESQEAGATARLEQLPLTIGDWQGESLQLDPAIVQRAGFRGYVSRRYVNQRTGAAVNVLVACGRPGPLAVHTPEVCFGGVGFTTADDPSRCTFAGASGETPAEFFKGTFIRKDSISPEKLRVLWSWNKREVWGVSDNPRWTFAGVPILYKAYVTQSFVPHDDATDGEVGLDFVREFLPELDKALGNGQ